jgi:hypothetical protein
MTTESHFHSQSFSSWNAATGQWHTYDSKPYLAKISVLRVKLSRKHRLMDRKVAVDKRLPLRRLFHEKW